jgi:hypothetical protein
VIGANHTLAGGEGQRFQHAGVGNLPGQGPGVVQPA